MTNQTIHPALEDWMWGEVPADPPSRAKLAAQFARLAHGDLAAVIAVANELLPDGHPLKITRDDVANVLAFANYLREYSSFGIAEMFQQDDYRTLAAKLAALLPPEE